MALINCPDCGKAFSDQAASCPNCGYPNPRTKNNGGRINITKNNVSSGGGNKNNQNLMLLIIIAVLAIALAVLGVLFFINRNKNINNEPEKQTTDTLTTAVTDKDVNATTPFKTDSLQNKPANKPEYKKKEKKHHSSSHSSHRGNYNYYHDYVPGPQGVIPNDTLYYEDYEENAYSERDISTPFNVNGYEAVDLGLPSGCCWASCNYGANSSSSYGSRINFFDLQKVTKSWQGWRMPTSQDMKELIKYCIIEHSDNGYTFVGPNGNSIFLPSAGYRDGNGITKNEGIYGDYWTSTQVDGENAYELSWTDNSTPHMNKDKKYYSASVRLVTSSR